MAQVKVGPKYQVVIPKEVRRGLKIRPGDRVDISRDRRGRVILSRSDSAFLDQFQGALKGAWDAFGGPDKYLEDERNAWGRD